MKKIQLLILSLFCFWLSSRAEEKLLYSTNFTDWTAVSTYSPEYTVSKTTSFTKEALDFTIYYATVDPAKYDATRFNYLVASTGAIIAQKNVDCYIITSALKTISKVEFIEGATGSSRGFKVWRKSTGDADWVAVYSDVCTTTTGQLITLTFDTTVYKNTQLKFTNLNTTQNAYLFSLNIYGDYRTAATQDTLKTSVSPSSAGTISLSPNSTTYDEGSQIILTATKNFGYSFSHWADGSGNTISTKNPDTITITTDTSIVAVFNTLNTYSLTKNATGGGKSYMVSVSPSGTTVNDSLMYEEGTSVTLTANSNQILTFTNWTSGSTSSTLSLTMNSNQTATAVYSTIDYIVGWDFYKSGNNGRIADFYSTSDNDASALILRTESGTTTGWLDKSYTSAGSSGYEGEYAAVNWQDTTSHYYYQISFVATDFTDIKVEAAMMYNYNAYSKQLCQYSLDNSTWTTVGYYEMTTAKTWYDSTYTLPSAADHASKVYIRWIPDYNSTKLGTASANDGTAISNIYVTATASVYNDGVAPILKSSVPESGATNASATGSVILTYDEKVQITSTTATLGSKSLTPTVSGKTIIFPYSGLDYNTNYTFTLSANTVSDLSGNTSTTEISFSFTTMNRPTVTKKKYDFIVGVDGTFKAALTAASSVSSSGDRYYIFFPTGSYDIGSLTGDANQMTTISIPNVSYIGEYEDSVTIYNKSTSEAINTTATMYLTSSSTGIYMQDLTLMNKMDYRNYVDGTLTLVGRGVALWDQGTKNIYKNVSLCSNQDTYYTGSGIRTYWENGTIHGTVDFICGNGDIFFNQVNLYLENRTTADVICAPATSSSWGYVFNSCTIDGGSNQKGAYSLGRPWQSSPRAVYLNTTMNITPTASGWSDMSVLPGLFAEYNSMTSSGNAVDLSSRKTSFLVNSVSTSVTYNPVLTATEAATYTMDNVIGGSDTWQPNLYTEQSEAPVISCTDGLTITWDNSNYVLCWAICKNGYFSECDTFNYYTIPESTTSGTIFTVRAANEMGGLSEASNQYVYTKSSTGVGTLTPIASSKEIVKKEYFTVEGRSIQNPVKGINLIRITYSDGSVDVKKVFINNLLYQ
jgi:pectin methylesterase-like acyl-CoA thioesterase